MAELKAEGHTAEFQGLHVRRLDVSISSVMFSFAMVLLAWAAVVWGSLYAVPFAVLVIASRQRALGNNLHDAAHGNIWGTGAELWGQWILAAPMFEEFTRYRKRHLSHHANLSHPDLDPDHVSAPPGLSSRALYWALFTDFRMWMGNALGELPAMSWAARIKVVLWWGVVTGGVSAIAGSRAGLALLALWVLSRATSYHALKVFTELSDHVGLEPGTILGYTRNCPRNVLSWFIHPHNDNFHLTHHLAPRIPMPNLGKAHALLLALPGYRRGQHCDGYFVGACPVVQQWTPEAEALPIRSSSPGRPSLAVYPSADGS